MTLQQCRNRDQMRRRGGSARAGAPLQNWAHQSQRGPENSRPSRADASPPPPGVSTLWWCTEVCKPTTVKHRWCEWPWPAGTRAGTRTDAPCPTCGMPHGPLRAERAGHSRRTLMDANWPCVKRAGIGVVLGSVIGATFGICACKPLRRRRRAALTRPCVPAPRAQPTP